MLKRTHNCGQLRLEDADKKVTLSGWVQSYRDHGNLVFIDLWDREGLTQIVFDPETQSQVHKLVRTVRCEWVVAAEGLVRPRSEGMANPKLVTGEIEVLAERLEILNTAKTPPFEIDSADKTGEELLISQENFARSLVFSDGKNWSIIDQYNAKGTESKISAVAAFDIDGEGAEGRPAILLLDGQKGQLQILKAGFDNTYRFEKELDVGKWNAAAKHLKMLFAPLTGSDVRSILLFDGDKFALITPPSASYIPQHLEQQFSYETKIKDGVYGNLTAGDINSDDRIDIIMVEYKHNHIEILALDSDMKPIPAMRFKVFEQKSYRDSKKRARTAVEPRELKIADVTGDGKNDLVAVIHDRIIIYPQD